jgi:DNA-binding transcriptional LysR family regulator
MNLDDLRVFAAVCDAGNLSVVARELGCTQPAVAQRVSRLERELGIALLDRRPRGVSPTPAGALMRRACDDALGALGAAVRSLEALRTGETGRLCISTGPTTVRHFMQQAIVTFRARYPAVALELQPNASTRKCLDALSREPLDLAFVTVGIPWRGLEQRAVLEASHELLVRDDHKLARRKRVKPAELRSLHFVGLRAYVSPDSQLARELADQGIVIGAQTVVDDWDTAALMVSLGLGEAIVPSLHARTFAQAGGVVGIPIEGLLPIRFGWAARRFADLSPVARDFIALVDQHVATLADDSGCRYLPA